MLRLHYVSDEPRPAQLATADWRTDSGHRLQNVINVTTIVCVRCNDCLGVEASLSDMNFFRTFFSMSNPGFFLPVRSILLHVASFVYATYFLSFIGLALYI